TVTVRVGDLVDTISAFTGEVEADTILIGTPRSAADARFAADGVGEFADELRQRTGAMVMVMSP
ncbi:MAG: hypothetical protein OEX97_06850, partial [Acidimicrobiia bacterium]|nr:hypothetical protein [Acidimicrobiia bacterium]